MIPSILSQFYHTVTLQNVPYHQYVVKVYKMILLPNPDGSLLVKAQLSFHSETLVAQETVIKLSQITHTL